MRNKIKKIKTCIVYSIMEMWDKIVDPFQPFYNTKRKIKYWWQRKIRGFDNSEVWNLDHAIAIFVLPKLKYFREHHNGYPGHQLNEQEWDIILDKMIFAMEVIVNEWNSNDKSLGMDNEARQEYWRRVQEGLELFGKWMRDLWD